MTPGEVVDAIYVEGVCRRQLHSAEKRLGLQIKAILRSLKRTAGEVGEPEEEDQESDGSQDSIVPSSGPREVEDAERSGARRVLKPRNRVPPPPASPEVEEGAVDQEEHGAHPDGVPAPSSVLESALGPVLAVLEEHRLSLKKSRGQHERVMEHLAEELPVWSEWLAGVRGCGPLGLALIIAETGDLSNYANPAKVWKRMGLAVIGGERQHRVADAAGALLHGYCPRRRAVAWNMGESFVKQGDRYRELYLQRKAIEAEKPPCGKKWRTKAGGMAGCEKDGHCKAGHIHARAKRWVEKKFLAELWGAWNRKPAPALDSAA